MTRDSIVESIRAIASDGNATILRFADFQRSTGVTLQAVLKHLDSWSDACKSAGVTSGVPKLKRNPLVSKDACIAEMRRVASLLKKTSLTREEFTQHSQMSSITPRRRFGGWPQALAAAGLDQTTFVFPEDVPLEQLVPDFLSAVRELKKIPSLHQLSRRSSHGRYLFSVKYGGYSGFKKRAIENLLADDHTLSPETIEIINAELRRLSPSEEDNNTALRAHQHGRILGFRAFAHQPTYEMEVVSLFSVVADELGFEIISQRGEFPDCEAQRRQPGRRMRYAKCLIEFELRSSDFRTHGHPVNGCDLIVCWEHDWPACPLEVLELRKAIRPLPGWR